MVRSFVVTHAICPGLALSVKAKCSPMKLEFALEVKPAGRITQYRSWGSSEGAGNEPEFTKATTLFRTSVSVKRAGGSESVTSIDPVSAPLPVTRYCWSADM